MSTASLHHLQLVTYFPHAHEGGPAEVLARGTLFHLALPGPPTQHALQAPGGWNAGLKQQQQQRQQQRAAHVWWRQVLSAASLHLSVWPGEGDSFVAPGLLPEILRKSESAADAWVTPSPPPTPLLLKNFLCQGAAGQE